MWRDDACLLDMLLAARKVQRFCADVTWEQFASDEMLRSAVMMQIQIIGEAARKVSAEFRDAHPEIPWPGVIGMRNRLVHEYFRIVPEKVWDVAQKEVPALAALLEPLVPPDEPPGANR